MFFLCVTSHDTWVARLWVYYSIPYLNMELALALFLIATLSVAWSLNYERARVLYVLYVPIAFIAFGYTVLYVRLLSGGGYIARRELFLSLQYTPSPIYSTCTMKSYRLGYLWKAIASLLTTRWVIVGGRWNGYHTGSLPIYQGNFNGSVNEWNRQPRIYALLFKLQSFT